MNSGHHKTIFSKRLGCLVAVGEHASSQGKANGAASGQFSGFAGSDWLSTVLQFVGVLTASCVLVTLAWAGPVATTALPNSLPTGGQVAQGAAAISQSGAVMNITQSTPKAVLNWNTFDIGQNAKVNIVQPSANAVMLNRVTSANPSQILGLLNANGQVVLVNPNGVLFGKDGSVNASSFTASTLGISDANFMAGNNQFERNGSTAAVVNQGRINTTGGYVALLGASVSNEGQINTQGGTAYLAAAETVKIPVSGSGRIKLELSPSRINAAVANGKTGTIVTEGGQVYMQAASLSTMVASIIQSGSVDTSGEQGGAVHLLADGGNIKVDGSITANSAGTGNKGGDIVIGRDEVTGVLADVTDVSRAHLETNQGFVETSAHHLTVDDATVKAASWLLDPDNIDITKDNVAAASGYSKIKASTISNSLNLGTSVLINTTSAVGAEARANQPGYSNVPGTGTAIPVTGVGNILVTEAIVKSGASDATLTLIADNGITVNARVGKASGDTTSAGKLNVNMTAIGGVAATSAGLVLNNSIDANGGNVVLSGTNRSNASLNANSGVTFGYANIDAANLTVTGLQTSSSGTDKNGIYFSATSVIRTTGTTVFTGTSNVNGVQGAGIYGSDSSNLKLDSGAGEITFNGSNTIAGNNDIRFGYTAGTAKLEVTGKVTFNAQGPNGVTQTLLRGAITQKSNSTVNFTGKGVSIYAGASVAQDTGATGTSLNLNTSGFVVVGDLGAASLSADTMFIKGASAASAKNAVNINSTSTVTSSGTITIEGNGTGGAAGVVVANGANVTGNVVTVTGTSDTNAGIWAGAGGLLKATGGNLTIDGKITSAASANQGVNLLKAVEATSGLVKITGTAAGTGNGVNTAAVTGKSVEIDGTSVKGGGVVNNGLINATAGGVKVDGKVTGDSFSYATKTNTITATADINITGTGSSKYGINLGGSGLDAGGSITMNADTTASGGGAGSGTSNGIDGTVPIKAVSNINITAKTNGFYGIQALGAISSTNGYVDITGTSRDSIGVNLTNMITAKNGYVNLTGNGNRTMQGININALNAGVEAGYYKVVGNSGSGSGIVLNGTTTNTSNFISTSTTTASAIEGKTTSGTWGVDIQRGALNIDSGAGQAFVQNASGSNGGVTVGGSSAGLTVNTKGDVTFGSVVDTKSNLVMRGAVVNALGGKLTLLGRSTGTVDAISFQDASGTEGSLVGTKGATTNGAVILVDGRSEGSGAGVNMRVSAIKSHTVTSNDAGGSITIKGTSATGNGVNVDIAKITANDGNAIVITGDASTAGTGAGKGVYMASAVTANAGGNIDITGTSKGTGYAVHLDINGGTGKLTADKGKVTIKGNSATVAGTAEGVYNSGIISGGSVEIEGFSVGAKAGVYSGTGGSSSAGAGTITSTTGDTVITGTSKDGNGVGIYAAVSSAGDVKITGTSTGTLSSAGALSLQGSITAANNVTIKGENTNAGNSSAVVYVNKAITATSGKVDVTATTAGGTSNALQLDSGAILTGKTEVNIKTDTLSIASGATISATDLTTGKVTIKTVTAEAKIDIGSGTGTGLSASGVDSGAGTRTLGLSVAELGRITAANTVIGDIATHTGGITVSGETSTATATGNITLETKGNIDVKNTLSAANDKNLTLKAIGDINVDSTISQGGAGNIVLAAGFGQDAGVGTGGQVKGTGDVNNGHGTAKTYIYTGKVADSAKMSDLNGAFNPLTLSGSSANAQSFTDSNGTNTISGSTATMQVMYREKIAVDLNNPSNNGINNQLFNATKTYGDVSQSTLDSDAQTALKAFNADKQLSWKQADNTFELSSYALINTLSVIDAAYSTADKLKASGTAYTTTSKTYSVSSSTGMPTLKIDPKSISGSISGVSTVYGSNAAPGSVSLAGVIDDDIVKSVSSVVVTASAVSSSGNKRVGFHTQSVDGTLGGDDSGNYTFSGTSSANYVVTKLALNTQIAGVTTTYGTAAATGAASVSGVLSGDKVDLGNAKATLVNAVNSSSGNLKAGTYQQTVANSLNGVDADNYTAAPTSLANYVVTPKAIAATVTAADKVYDGNNVATLNANSAGILTGDVVNVLGATGTFASKNVARDGAGNVVAQTVTVTGTGVGLGGTDGANYTLTNATSIASTTAKITPKDLSVSGITASDKVYDGSTAAAINSANALLSGVVAGDSVSVSSQTAKSNFADKNVAFDASGAVASQAVTVSGLTLNGADAVNYNVSDKSGATAKVLQRALSITGSVAQDKTVDGNTNAQVKPGQLVNLVAGESLVVSATGQFADAEIGTNKAVTTQYALANGANGVARNYSLAGEVLRAAILVASINPVQPIVNPSRTGGGGRVVVSGSGNSGAALGVADGEEEIISREECSVLNPEKCECQESTIAGVEMCFAPTLAANTKN